MKNSLLFFIALTLFLFSNTFAQFNTPGTGVKWDLNDLVSNSAGAVTFASGNYVVNADVTVRTPDTLNIITDETVRFAAGRHLQVYGTIIVNPPTGVTFTPVDTSTRFLGVRIDSSVTSVLRKLTLEYANSLRLFDCEVIIDSCIFRENSTLTSWGNAAISLFRAKPVITNSKFIDNYRAAIQGGANIANAPQIIGNYFMGNNKLNGNVPQINLGQSGTDTVRILNNQLLESSTNSGAIGFLPLGTLSTVISGNVIKNNRYGITLSGGSNINSLISYNEIDSNNTQNNPAIGGSGIAFGGGSEGSHQNSIVTGNLIRWNLWGVTIQQRAKPNLGNLTNTDTTDNGKNFFIGNTNTSTPGIDLYNNTIDTIYAQNNFWGTEDPDSVEYRIFHQVDDPLLGIVIFSPPIIPVELTAFSAEVKGNSVLFNWTTATELNNKGFEILRNSQTIAFIPGSGTTTEPVDYYFMDERVAPGVYNYSLVQIDYDGTRRIEKVIEIEIGAAPAEYSLKQNYPNPFNPSTVISFSIPIKSDVSIKVYNLIGEEIAELINGEFEAGVHQVNFDASGLSSGTYFYRLNAGDFSSSKKMLMIK
jgi:hypothetical protein